MQLIDDNDSGVTPGLGNLGGKGSMDDLGLPGESESGGVGGLHDPSVNSGTLEPPSLGSVDDDWRYSNQGPEGTQQPPEPLNIFSKSEEQQHSDITTPTAVTPEQAPEISPLDATPQIDAMAVKSPLTHKAKSGGEAVWLDIIDHHPELNYYQAEIMRLICTNTDLSRAKELLGRYMTLHAS